MSYATRYSGELVVKKEVDTSLVKTILKDSNLFSNGDIYTGIVDGETLINFDGNGNYWDNEVFAVLRKLVPLVDSGAIVYDGVEDSTWWKHELVDGNWMEAQGEITYGPSSPIPKEVESMEKTMSKNENDVRILRQIIKTQNAKGAKLPEDLDNPRYTWNEDGRLVAAMWFFCDLRGSLSLEGLDALENLGCGKNHLTSIDVKNNAALKEIHCSDNRLASLDISGCPKLQVLDCHDNRISELDVSGNPQLKQFDCFGNMLQCLNVSECPELEKLNCAYNRIDSLNINGCTTLKYIDCHNNQLECLDVSQCSELKDLSCSRNRLASLDVTGCKDITDLYCRYNRLEYLDVSGCSALKSLNCRDNQITKLDITGCRALEDLNYDDEVAVHGVLEDLDYDNGDVHGNPEPEMDV